DASDANEASHELPIPPDGNWAATPNKENHPSRGVRVANTTAQNIHFVKLPPIRNFVPPSRLKLIPARTRATRAAGGASYKSTWTMSFNSCGTAMALVPFASFNRLELIAARTLAGSPVDFSVFPACLPGPLPERPFSVYVTPPVPLLIQNSINRVSPETASNPAAAASHLPTPRPCSQDTTAPTTAPPAPTGAMTLPIQLMKFRNAPSGWAAVSP